MSETPVATPKRPANLGPEFIYARVAIDGSTAHPEGIFWAWVDPTNLWNGFAQPVFELEEAQQVTAWCGRDSDSGPSFVWCSDGKTLIEVHRDWADGRDEDLTTIYRGPTYAIGDGWCWQFVEEPRYALKPGGVAARDLLYAAADLLEPENLTLASEYTRGICELLADSLLLTREAFMDERKEIVLDLIRREKNGG